MFTERRRRKQSAKLSKKRDKIHQKKIHRMTFTSLFAPVKIRSSIFHKTSKASLKWRRSSGLQWLWRRWCVTRWNCSFFIHTAQSSSSYMHLNRTTALLEGNHHQLHLRRRSLDTIRLIRNHLEY